MGEHTAHISDHFHKFPAYRGGTMGFMDLTASAHDPSAVRFCRGFYFSRTANVRVYGLSVALAFNKLTG